jgi:pimeloyl-ACP methyl ester carboxylesterase
MRNGGPYRLDCPMGAARPFGCERRRLETRVKTQRLKGWGGVALAADVGGPPDGAPVMLMHGGGQTRGAWKKAATALAEAGHHVISLDLRGHGESDWASDANYSMDAFAADLSAVASTLDQPPALVGASLGGMSALCAMGSGLEARALVLVDIVPKMNRDGAGKIGAFMRANPEGFASLDEAADAVAAYLPHRPRPADPSGLMRNLRERDGRLYWHWDPNFMSNMQVRGSSPEMGDRMEAAARAVSVPTLLVRGELSELVDEAAVAGFLRLMPHAEAVDVAGAAHMVAGDKNDAFNDAVLAFLAKTP